MIIIQPCFLSHPESRGTLEVDNDFDDGVALASSCITDALAFD
jgi:hypothetical protein